MTGQRRKVGVLISGRGSNMAALIEAAEDPDYPAEIVIVLSDNPEAPGLGLALDAGIPAETIPRSGYTDRQDFEAALSSRLLAAGVEIVCLAGFMRVLGPGFLGAWSGKLINIHPSLLPAYPGLDTHERVLAAGEREHGCSVHFVTEGVDEGPVIGQVHVAVEPDDTPEKLAARVLAEEHRLYPACLRLLAEDRLRLADGRVEITSKPSR